MSQTRPNEPDFAALLDRFEGPLLRYARATLGRQHADAQDVVQEAFLRLHRQHAERGLGGIENLATWLYRVTHNAAIDALRRAKARPERVGGAQVEFELEGRSAGNTRADNPPGELGRKEACAVAMSELETLPEIQRSTITLKIIEGMTMKQIGDVLGMAPSNVCYHISQGLAELARRLKRKGLE